MVERQITDMHTWVEERLSAHIDGQLAPDERTRIESHLAECKRCQGSLEALRWTVSLLKQAPAPAMPRSFTLPVTRKEAKVGGLGFAYLRGATALATLLLCLVVGLDLYLQSRFGFASAPSAPMPAAQFAAPTQNIALAPAATSVPTSAPAAAPPIAPTTAPAATQAPRLSQPAALSTATRPPSVGAAEVQATRAQADDALKAMATITVSPQLRSGITTTVPSPSPAPTQLVPTATSTFSAVARTQPTRETSPSSTEAARGGLPAIRAIEIGLLGVALVLGLMTMILWRRR